MPNSYIPLSDLLAGVWPEFLGSSPDLGETLDKVGVSNIRVLRDQNTSLPIGVQVEGAVLDEVHIDLPLIPGLGLRTGSPRPDHDAEDDSRITPYTADFQTQPQPVVSLHRLALRLSVPGSLLQRWRRTGATWQRVERGRHPEGVEVGLVSGITFNLAEPAVRFDEPQLTAVPADYGVMLGSSGILLHGLTDLRFRIDPSLPEAERGLQIAQASVSFVKEGSAVSDLAISLRDCLIGAGGFSGSIRLSATDTSTRSRLPGFRLLGFECRFQSLEATFRQSVPTSSRFVGFLHLPFFNDSDTRDWLPIEACLGESGELELRLGGERRGEQLVRIQKPGVLDLTVESLALRRIDQVVMIEISGSLHPLLPLVPGMTWPTIRLRGLRIDSNGQVVLPGGRLRLDDPLRVSMGGFAAELRSISFGEEREGDIVWSSFGFSGLVQLANGLSTASFDNLRIQWQSAHPDRTRVLCEGIALSGRIPGLLHLSGAASFRENQFSGGLDILFESLRGLRLIADFLAGREPEFTYWFFRLGLELPAGIPLAATGLSLYGGKAMLGQNWTTNRRSDEGWFDGWYLRTPKGLGLNQPQELREKWGPRSGAWIFGAGITVGTGTDDGFVMTGQLMLVVTLPGPVIFLEGQAAALNRRAEFPAEPPFRAVVILDLERSELLVGLNARFTLIRILEIAGSAEAFFSLRDSSAWHLYIGQDTPESKRITARILALFQSNLYFMLDPRVLRQGATVQYGNSWHFGPVELTLRVRLDERVEIFWQPLQLAGMLALEGEVRLAIFGIGLGLYVAARLEGQAPAPLEVAGILIVRVTLPWPIPELRGELAFRWRQEAHRSPWVNPVEGVHVQDEITGRAFEPLVAEIGDGTPPPDQTPIVPLDGRLVVRFGRPMDAAGSVASIPPGATLAPPGSLGQLGEELPGISGRFVSRIVELELAKRDGETWQTIAHADDPEAPLPADRSLSSVVWGSWRPMPDRQGQEAALQFELFNRYGFHFRDDPDDPHHRDRLLERARQACIIPMQPRWLCADFSKLPEGQRFGSTFVHQPGVFRSSHPTVVRTMAGAGPQRGLVLRLAARVVIDLDEPAGQIEVQAESPQGLTVTAISNGAVIGSEVINGEGFARFMPGLSQAITQLQLDTEGMDPFSKMPPFLLESVYRPAISDQPPEPDCLRYLEDLLLFMEEALVPSTPTKDESILLEDRITQRLSFVSKETLGEILPVKDEVQRSVESWISCVGKDSDYSELLFLFKDDKFDAMELLDWIARAGKHYLSAPVDSPQVCLDRLRLAQQAFAAEIALLRYEMEIRSRPVSLGLAVLDARVARYEFQRCAPRADQVSDPTSDSESAPINSTAAVLRQICWVTAQDLRTIERAGRDQQRFEDIMREYSSSERLLEPDSLYRLHVKCRQENPEISGSPMQWTQRYYFRTEGPPGAFLVNDKLDRLDRYIRASSPRDNETEVFRAHGCAFEFNRNYVPGLYSWPDFQLRFELREADGTPVLVPDSTNTLAPLEVILLWEVAVMTTSRPHETLLQTGLAQAPCNISLPEEPGDPRLVVQFPDGYALAPRHVYQAVLLGGRTGRLRELATFRFTTGRYREFSEIVQQARIVGPQFRAPEAASAFQTRMRPQQPFEPKAEDGLFDAALVALGLAPRPNLPSVLQTVALGNDSEQRWLLVELPQPLDFRRLLVSVVPNLDPEFAEGAPLAGAPLGATLAARTDLFVPNVLRSADGTRMILQLPDRVDLISRHLAILFRYSRELSEPARYPDSAVLVFGRGMPEVAGVLVRHAEVQP